MIPNSRLDALTDGVFAFAMTLLVVDMRLPEGFVPASGGDLLHGLSELEPRLIAYLVSFWVLGMRWLAMAQQRIAGETVTLSYAQWSLAHLFFITFIPFSTMMVGRYSGYAPTVWLYAANLILAALVSLRMTAMAERKGDGAFSSSRRLGLMILIGIALLSVAVSFVSPRYALWIYVLNMVVPPLHGLWARKAA